MALVTIPFAFSADTLAQSAQVNANFTALANYINNGSGSIGTNGYVVLPGGFIAQWGTVASAPSDGSAAGTITFDEAFPNACFGLVPVILNNYAALPRGYHAPTVPPASIATTGASVYVTGGNAGETVSIFFLAIGW